MGAYSHHLTETTGVFVMPEKEMNAATLTNIRTRANQGPDGDRVFLVGCQLSYNGEAALNAFQQAKREIDADLEPGQLRHGHLYDQRVADRLIELVNGTEAQEPSAAKAEPYSDEDFDEWMKVVNQRAIVKLGIGATDLPDQLWRDWFNSGLEPSEALDNALENEGITL